MSVPMEETLSAIRKYAPSFVGKVGIVLGSGLGEIADQLSNPITIPYQVIPGLQTGSVQGHASQLVMGLLNEVPVICMKGRLHLYEGASYESLRSFVRMVKHLGAETMIITGAVGSLRPDVGAGEVVLVKDHINLQPGNPLLGPNDESIGPRFLSLEDAYDPGHRELVKKVAGKLNIDLHEGVYMSVLGPSFETPAEIKAYKMLGADVIGMSVVPEVIIARHSGMRVLCLTAITNLAVGMSAEKVTHEGTLEFAQVGARKLVKLIPQFIKELTLGKY